MLIAWVSEDDAQAINTAGSLRMATYRLNWKLEAGASDQELAQLRDDLTARLNNPALQHIVGSVKTGPLWGALTAISQHWQEQLLPALEARDKQRFAEQSQPFIHQLEQFVSQLQRQSERRQSWQQSIQGSALLLTVVILLVGMYELHSSVLSPLLELVKTTERFRAGDLQARIETDSTDELGQMADSFNAMADAIEESHRSLALRVAEKTQQLALSNAALELLYQSSAKMAAQPASVEQLDSLIDSFQRRLPGLRLTLCLHGSGTMPVDQPLSLQGDTADHAVCTVRDCANCPNRPAHNGQLYSINSQGDTLGELRAHYEDGHVPLFWEQDLIQALANLIGASLSLEHQREQDHRILLFDERATIARELHDSLAQSLSYMKLQVSRLQTLISRDESSEKLLTVSGELRDGLNSAYRQLRELLTTFRLRIQTGGLRQALVDTADEFTERGNLPIELNCQALAFNLTATEQIHVLQIAREALSNCARHAQARHAWVSLAQHGAQIELSIEDDGVGIDPNFDGRLHHGLTIMQERAQSLGGSLEIGARTPCGTRVKLSFCPIFLRQQSGAPA